MLLFFIVLRKVGDVAQIDYTLVANPTFTSQYMDVPLKVSNYMCFSKAHETCWCKAAHHHRLHPLSIYHVLSLLTHSVWCTVMSSVTDIVEKINYIYDMIKKLDESSNERMSIRLSLDWVCYKCCFLWNACLGWSIISVAKNWLITQKKDEYLEQSYGEWVVLLFSTSPSIVWKQTGVELKSLTANSV